MQVRNEVIFILVLYYGLTLQELTNLKVNQVHFANNELELISRKGKRRVIYLTDEDRKKLFEYYMSIPEPVRPNRYDPMPFFIAFDYQKGTYRWDYEKDSPKNWTEVSIQKMIRLEGKRAGFRNVTGAHLRKTYIISRLLDGVSKEELKEELALESTQPLEKLENQYGAVIKEKVEG
ncbi:MAG: site-specific integrase [Bacillus sp. (in: Bacteria)]|nr:site-specific integrase [Bacillus sp. (in: firmicutes)]